MCSWLVFIVQFQLNFSNISDKLLYVCKYEYLEYIICYEKYNGTVTLRKNICNTLNINFLMRQSHTYIDVGGGNY